MTNFEKSSHPPGSVCRRRARLRVLEWLSSEGERGAGAGAVWEVCSGRVDQGVAHSGPKSKSWVLRTSGRKQAFSATQMSGALPPRGDPCRNMSKQCQSRVHAYA